MVQKRSHISICDEFISSSSSIHHQFIINSSSVYYLFIISSSLVHGQFIISSSSAYGQFIISLWSVDHQFIIKLWPYNITLTLTCYIVCLLYTDIDIECFCTLILNLFVCLTFVLTLTPTLFN